MRGKVNGVKVLGYRETMYFSEVAGQLCQWVEVDLEATDGRRKAIELEICSGRRSGRRRIVLRRGTATVRCYAPSLWPAPADTRATLVVKGRDEAAKGRITIGSHRPWTLYLLSDCCADDSWAYSDLAAHDRDDYRTTAAEVAAGEQNRYNLAAAYQVTRFFAQATPAEQRAFTQAVRSGRLYVTPVPNQLLCGAFGLSAYPLLLEPYRRWMNKIDPGHLSRPGYAYHMESPTWSGGLVNLFSCAGFGLFGKSLLRYLAPWISVLEEMPVLTRLEVAPGRHVYFVLRCNDYSEGMRILEGQPQTNGLLHNAIIPRYEGFGHEYPTSAIPIVGMYSDVQADLPAFAEAKIHAVDEYNSQPWTYPRLVNATWNDFGEHVAGEIGNANRPRRKGLRSVRGDSGSSWEAWMMSAQAEAARFRQAQRGLVSLRTLDAMLAPAGSRVGRLLDAAVLEVVELGDHAWNGSFLESQLLNLSIRRNRLSRAEAGLEAVRRRFAGSFRPSSLGVVNTLSWRRTCRVDLPEGWGGDSTSLADPETGARYPVRRGGGGQGHHAFVPDVEGFGCRVLELRTGEAGQEAAGCGLKPPVPRRGMRPLLHLDGREVRARGRWTRSGGGTWKVGPFSVTASLEPLCTDAGAQLSLRVQGTPPKGRYELRWLFDLPWREGSWRGDSGGGFSTPGPTEAGGDSLLGVTGSVYSCGEGLSAADADGQNCIDFAFDQTGLCGLGGRSTRAAVGTYGEHLSAGQLRASVWQSCLSKGRLELYLLGNSQNFREAIPDQGGAREWTFRCALRGRCGGLDDAALHRFACGAITPAEVVRVRDLPGWRGPWLQVRGSSDVIVLGVSRSRASIEMDLYNTARRARKVRLVGPAVAGRALVRADMLGRELGKCSDGEVPLEPHAFVKAIVSQSGR